MKDYILYNSEIRKIGENGFYQLEKDKLAINSFKEEVEELFIDLGQGDKYKHYIKLIENNYYADFTKDYTEEQVRSLIELVYGVKFSFKSFMAISKFYKDYALKTDDGKNYVERYEDRVIIVAMYLSRGDYNKAYNLIAPALIEQRLQPATPTFKNAGLARGGELVSCFLDELDDSLNSINFGLGEGGQLSKIGGGFSINMSKLRHSGDPINGVDNAAKGIVPVMKLFEDMASYADQQGQRPGAFAAYNIIFSKEIIHFIDTKKANADEKIRMKTLSTGVIIPSKFMEIALKNEDFYVFSGHSLKKETGLFIDEIDWDKDYEKLVANPRIKKSLCKLSARNLLTRIVQTQIESGYPYIFFKDNANRNHALKLLGDVNFSNLCTEIMQLSKYSEITNYGEEDKLGLGISCNLASLNVKNVMNTGKLEESVYAGMDSLNTVSDNSDVKNAPSINKANKLLHAVGLGYMNLAGYLAEQNIFYSSAEGRDFARSFAMAINYYSLKRSMETARDKRKTFYGYEKSSYATGEYFDKYLVRDYTAKSKKVKALFENAGITLPTPKEWAWLKTQVSIHGIYNAYRLAIAPTQGISYIQDSTQSVMPVTHLIEPRTYGNASTYFAMPGLNPKTQYLYEIAYDMDQKAIIDMVSVIQEHVDQGISMILYVNRNVPTAQMVSNIFYAHERGLKSIYYVRNRAAGESQICESCSI